MLRYLTKNTGSCVIGHPAVVKDMIDQTRLFRFFKIKIKCEDYGPNLCIKLQVKEYYRSGKSAKTKMNLESRRLISILIKHDLHRRRTCASSLSRT